MTGFKDTLSKVRQAAQQTAQQSTNQPKPGNIGTYKTVAIGSVTEPPVKREQRTDHGNHHPEVKHVDQNKHSMAGKVETQLVTARVPKALLREFDDYLTQTNPKMTRTNWLVSRMQFELLEWRSHKA